MPTPIDSLSTLSARTLSEAAEGPKMVFGTWRDVKNGGKPAVTRADHAAAAKFHDAEAAAEDARATAALSRTSKRRFDRGFPDVETPEDAAAHQADAAAYAMHVGKRLLHQSFNHHHLKGALGEPSTNGEPPVPATAAELKAAVAHLHQHGHWPAKTAK